MENIFPGDSNVLEGARKRYSNTHPRVFLCAECDARQVDAAGRTCPPCVEVIWNRERLQDWIHRRDKLIFAISAVIILALCLGTTYYESLAKH